MRLELQKPQLRDDAVHVAADLGGPIGFAAPWTLRGTFRYRFTWARTYRLFCSLHPAKMTQIVTVR
jgi:hypothetical protein